MKQVVIVGASLAGLFAAAAAADSGRTVTVLERDQLLDTAEPRRGVPQGRQPHILLKRGLLAAEELLPGLRTELITAGAVPFDTGDLPWLGRHGWFPLGRPAFEVVSATRPLFEQVVRRRVSALPGVQVRGGSTVTTIERDGDRWRVGVADPGGAEEPLSADLVIDASGRSSRLPQWLVSLGVPVAATSDLDARVGYATRMYAIKQPPAGVMAMPGVVVLATRETLTGGLALRVEDERWIVLAVGYGDRRPPRDPDGFEAFLRGLHDPVLGDLVRHGEPLGAVAVHRQTANRRHHYENVSPWPAGLLVVGDALCAFNPVYGQGITVAACQALLLRRALSSGHRGGDTRGLLRRIAAVTALPWAIATGEDVKYPTTAGRQSPVQRLLDWWTQELALLAQHGNGRAQDTMTRIYHLMGSPVSLLHPALPLAVIRARVAGYGPGAPRPESLAALAAPCASS